MFFTILNLLLKPSCAGFAHMKSAGFGPSPFAPAILRPLYGRRRQGLPGDPDSGMGGGRQRQRRMAVWVADGGMGGGKGGGTAGARGASADNRYEYPRDLDQLIEQMALLEKWKQATLASLESYRVRCDGCGVGTHVWLARNGFFCLVCWKRFWDKSESWERKQIPDNTGAGAAAAEIPPDSSAPAARTASRRARRQRAAARAAAAKGSRRHNTSKADGKGRQRQGGGKEHRQCQADRQDR